MTEWAASHGVLLLSFEVPLLLLIVVLVDIYYRRKKTDVR